MKAHHVHSTHRQHRSEPTGLFALRPTALTGLDFAGLIQAAEGLAQQHLKHPKVQRVEVSIGERGPGVLVAFLDPRQRESYLVRLGVDGKVTFEDHSPVKREAKNPRLPVFEKAPTDVTLSPAEALERAMAQHPGARYQILSLTPGTDGPVYSAFHPSDFETNPSASVPVRNPGIDLTALIEGRPQPIATAGARKLVQGQRQNPFTQRYAAALAPDNPFVAFLGRIGLLRDVRNVSVADAHALVAIFHELDAKAQRDTRGFLAWQLQTTPIQAFGHKGGEDARMILARLLLD